MSPLLQSRAAAIGLSLSICFGVVEDSSAGTPLPISEVSHIHGIAVDPSDPSRLFLATHHGFFLTSAGGTAVRISDNSSDYMGFTPHPTDPGILIASGHPESGGNMGVIISNNGGKTWNQMSAGIGGPVDFHAMTVSLADPNVLYGLFRDIQVSRDGGATWQIAGSPAADVFDLAASATDPNVVYAATRAGLMISRDAAKSWEPTADQGSPATMVQVAPNGTVFAFIVGKGLLRSLGAVLSWTPLASEVDDLVLLHLAFDSTDPNRMFAVTQHSQILSSLDGGKTWAPFGL